MLSRRWDVMLKLKTFHSNPSLAAQVMDEGPYRLRPVTRPWVMPPEDDIMSDPTGIRIHGPTGALCMHGIKITNLSEHQRFPSPNGVLFKGPRLQIAALPDAQQHDSLFFLHGLDSPVILRRRLDGRDDVYTFVCCCHVTIKTILQSPHTNVRGDPALRHHLVWLPEMFPESAFQLDSPITGTDHQRVREIGRQLAALLRRPPAEFLTSYVCALGRAAEDHWKRIVEAELEDMLFTRPARPADLMEPVAELLGELGRALAAQAAFWTGIVGRLERYGGSSAEWRLRAGTRPHERALGLKARLERLVDEVHVDMLGLDLAEDGTHRVELERMYLNGRGGGSSSSSAYDETNVLEATTQRVKEPAPASSSSSSSPLGGSVADEDGKVCPRWYRYLPGGTDSWYGMVKSQKGDAALYLHNAASWEDSEEGVELMERDLEAARLWKARFEVGMLDVEVRSRAAELLMEWRREYTSLTGGEWKKVIIV